MQPILPGKDTGLDAHEATHGSQAKISQEVQRWPVSRDDRWAKGRDEALFAEPCEATIGTRTALGTSELADQLGWEQRRQRSTSGSVVLRRCPGFPQP